MRGVMFLALVALLPDVALAPRHKVVHGISHSSIHLPTSFGQSPTEVIWKHETPKNTILIAKIQNGSMIDRLNDRYTLRNGRDLWIHNVTESDNGKYTIEATLADGGIVNKALYLMVYEPVPPVQITLETSRIGDHCYANLNCSVQSSASDLSYSWKFRYQDSEYQSIDIFGSRIQKILPLDHKDIEIVCTVHNPADQKNVSIHVEQCSEKTKTRYHMPIVFYLIIAALLFGVMFWRYSNRRGLAGHTWIKDLKTPVQESETSFISVTHGKTNMKTKEADEEVAI